MKILARIVLNGFALVAASYLLPGLHWQGGLGALLVAGLVLGVIHLIVRPIVAVLSCPLIVLTFGLFYLLINGAMLLLADALLDSFTVDGWVWAIAGGLFLALWNLVIRMLFEREPEPRDRR